MGELYSGVSISGYNSNPPDDDGSQTENNRVKWATTKDKIGDPLKDAHDDQETNLADAFGKIDGGVTSYSTSTAVAESDQGKLVRASVAGITITTPDATDVGAPFVFGFLNDTTGDVTFDGHDTQTVDGQTSVVVPAGCGFRVRTNGSNWFTEGRNFQRTQVKPQGYLTLLDVATYPTSPMPTSDQSAKTTVYYRPDGGNLLPISDGTNISVREFSELPLGLVSNHVANSIYDVFLFDDSGTLRIGTGPAWNTITAGSGARGTGAGTTELDLLKGLLVNKVAATMRNGSTTYSVAAKAGLYLGTISMDGSAGQLTCHVGYGQSRKWGVWNAYNRRKITLKAGNGSGYNIPASTTIRPAANNSANSIAAVSGLPEEQIAVSYKTGGGRTPIGAGGSVVVTNYIGLNSTSSAFGFSGWYAMSNQGGGNINTGGTIEAEYTPLAFIGANVFTALESNSGNNQWDIPAGEAGNLLTAQWAA